MGSEPAPLKAEPAPRVAPAAFVTVKLFATISGFTEKAVRRKIEEGIWLEGHEFVRSPTGGVLMSLPGYERWARGERA